MRRTLIAGLALPLLGHALFAGVSNSQAAGSRVQVERGRDFEKGEMDGLARDERLQLVPAPLHDELWPTDALYVWSLVRDARGRLVAGTGDGGVLYRQKGERLEAWAHTLAFEILSLLPTDDGLLAGSSPDGIVYRIDDDGGVEVALDLPQQSIWALAPGVRAGSWLVGGGPSGRLIRAGAGAPAGEALLELPVTNITVLHRNGDELWIGTQGPGLVYHMRGDKPETARVVFEAEEDEIRAILDDGNAGVFVLGVAPPGGAPPKANGEPPVRSRISWLPASGGSETVHASPARLLSLARLSDGALLAGEAEKGLLHRIDLSGGVSVWADLEGGDPIALLVDKDGGIAVGTGNVGRVHLLRAGRRDSGSYTSKVMELEHVEAWGRLDVEADRDGVRFATRSGFRRQADETWSEWSDTQPGGRVIASPVAPFLQYRLEVPGGEDPVHVAAVRVAYRERNLPPRVRAVVVEPAGSAMARGGLSNSPSPVSQRFDDGLAVEYSVYQRRESASPDESAFARGVRTVRWEADDPNGDPLNYRVELRQLPDGQWYPLAEKLEQELLAWDTRSFEDGRYRLRIVARDDAANPESSVREGEAHSATVHVDNSAPRILELSWANRERSALKARVSDAGSPLADVALRVGEGQWRPVDPEDGVLDGFQESFHIPRPAALLEGGVEAVWLRATDAAGNVTVGDLRLP